MTLAPDALRELVRTEQSLADHLSSARFPWRPDGQYWRLLHAWSRSLRQLALVCLRPSGDPVDGDGASTSAARAEHWLGRPIFIVGPPRSGTTLVLDLLDGHPCLQSVPFETLYHSILEPRLRRLPESERLLSLALEWACSLVTCQGRPPFFALGRSTPEAQPYLDFVVALVRSARSRIGRDRASDAACLEALAGTLCACTGHGSPSGWVEKSPRHERYARLLTTLFAEARFVHVLREPAAVVRSRQRLETVAGTGAWRPVDGALEVRRSYRLALAGARKWPSRYHLVRYEDLVADREPTMRHLAAQLELDWHPALLQATRLGRPISGNSSFSGVGDQLLDERPISNAVARHLWDLAPALGYPLPDRVGAFDRVRGPAERFTKLLGHGFRRAGDRLGRRKRPRSTPTPGT